MTYSSAVSFHEFDNILGQYTIEQIQPQADGAPSKIKVKVRLNRNGIFDVTQACLIETIEEPAAPGKFEFQIESHRFIIINFIFYYRSHGNNNTWYRTSTKWY